MMRPQFQPRPPGTSTAQFRPIIRPGVPFAAQNSPQMSSPGNISVPSQNPSPVSSAPSPGSATRRVYPGQVFLI